MAEYQYTLNTFNSNSLLEVIKASGLTSVTHINTVGTDVFIYFPEALSTEDEDTLDGIVDAHELLTAKNKQHQAVNDLRSLKLIGGYTDGSSRKWGTTPTDISNLSGVCTLIALGVVSEEQTWRDFANVNHTLTPPQLVQLAAELAIFVRTCYELSWYHKAQIDALTTVEDIQAYDITTGWPS